MNFKNIVDHGYGYLGYVRVGLDRSALVTFVGGIIYDNHLLTNYERDPPPLSGTPDAGAL